MSRSLRYRLILTLVAVGTGLAALTGWRYARVSAPVTGPIILISIDSLRADHLPVYGYGAGTTPAIDALAKDGLVFERAYSHVPQTLPAHASILTGRLPFEHGVRDGVGFTVSAGERLLAEMLADRGYATAGLTSSYLLRKATGIGQGFSLFDAGEVDPSHPSAPLIRDGSDTERMAERWFDSLGTTRAFLFLHLAEPGTVDAGTTDASTLTYDTRITKADDIVGRLVRYLKARQLYNQSTIIVLGDHGQGLGEHGEQGHGLLLNEDVLHVPLVIKPAAGGRGGRRVKTPVQHVDIVPTILDLAKAPVPDNLRGRSLTPLFDDGGHFDTRTLYAETLFGHYHFGWEPLTSITDGHYRLVSGASAMLFDLDAQTGRNEDIAQKQPEATDRLLKALADVSRTAPVAPMEAVANADRVRLERLGYVGTLSTAVSIQPTPSPTDPSIVEQYRVAVGLLAADRLPAAIDAFRALAAKQSTSADVWIHLATAATRAEQHSVAADAYGHVVELTPANADGYLALSNALIRLRKFDDARTQAQKVIDGPIGAAPAAAMAHGLLARVALGRRNYEVARVEAARAEAADPTRPVVAYVNGRIAVEQRRYTAALEFFEPALAAVEAQQLPPLDDLRLYTAEVLLRSERLSEAEYLFLEELKEAPHNPRVLAGLMAVYKSSGRTDEAAALRPPQT
ncbi:MAG: sulfatase-like hydrolase/transferase [Vicinamibacterales bacterium]